MGTGENMIYLKTESKIQIKNESVKLRELATVLCKDRKNRKRMEEIEIFRFQKDMNRRQIIGILWIIQKLQEEFPNIEVIPLGPTDVIVEYIPPVSPMPLLSSHFFENTKIVFISLISFFGGAFSIMAFHNDIGISSLFSTIYSSLTGETGNQYTILEISYSIGLALGIILFFNHIGKKKITKDPTPIEVAMRLYENDVNTALADSYDRKRGKIDVH